MVRKQWNGYFVIVWPLVLLLILQAAYLIFEVAFNASLLNVASGAAGNADSISELETYGRLLSGIGLGLLIFARVASRPFFSQFREVYVALCLAFSALLIFPASIYSMWHLQSYLIDEVIVANADDEDRFAASYVKYVTPAMRQGLLSIEGVPDDPELIDRPETKTLITLLLPTLMHNDRLIAQLVHEAPDLVKFLSHRAALNNLNQQYLNYRSAVSEAEDLHDAYRSMVVKANDEIEYELSKARTGEGGLQDAIEVMEEFYSHYHYFNYEVFQKLGSNVQTNMNGKYRGCKNAANRLTGGIFQMAGSCYLTRKNAYRDFDSQFIYLYGFRPTFDIFCPDWKERSTCISDDETFKAGKIAYNHMPTTHQAKFRNWAKKRVGPKLQGIPLGLSVSEFFSHWRVQKKLAKALPVGQKSIAHTPHLKDSDFGVVISPNQKVSLNPQGYLHKAVYYKANKEVSSAIARELSSRFKDSASAARGNRMKEDPSVVSSVGVTEEEFYQLPFVRKLFEEKGVALSEGEALPEGRLSKQVFFDRHLLPRSLEQVDGVIQDMPETKFAAGQMTEITDQAIRAIYVPAIALGFSLFFSLTNLVSLIYRAGSIVLVIFPYPAERIGLWMSRITKAAGLALILALPVLITPNTLSQTQILKVAAEESDLVWAKWPLHWVLTVQPLIYPAGNTILGVSEWLYWYSYHDDQASLTSTKAGVEVQSAQIHSPLSVKQLQSSLKKQGHYSGEVDGIIGPKTTNAIKNYQISHGLPVTGYQDSDTIRSLMEGGN